MKVRVLLKYGRNIILEQRKQTLFTVISISLVVALVISLQSLSIMSSESLEENALTLCGGDIRVSPFLGPLTLGDIQSLSGMEGEITYSYELWGKVKALSKEGNPLLFVIRGVPDTYPLYGSEERKQLFAELDHHTLIDRTLADRANLKVGDPLYILGESSPVELSVSGIVDPDGEDAEDMHIFGYGYVRYDFAAEILNQESQVSRLYIAIKKGSLEDGYESVKSLLPHCHVTTYKEFIEEHAAEYNTIMSFFAVVGLAAVCLGAVGVSSTVLLIVEKKTREIGILKSIGLKNRDIVLLFFFGLLVLSVVASVIGCVVGVILSYGAVFISNTLLYTTLSWSFKMGPILWGVGIGFGSILGFGFFPSLITRNIPPKILLRTDEQFIPKLSWKTICGEVSLVGVFVSVIMKSVWGLVLCYMVFLLTVALFYLFERVMAILSRIPGRGYRKMSLRNLRDHKKRNSLIMLTLILTFTIVGSVIALNENIKDAFEKSSAESLGFNVMIFHKKDDGLIEYVRGAQGVTEVTVAEVVPVGLRTVKGVPVTMFQEELQKYPEQQLFSSPTLMGLELPSSDVIIEGRSLTDSDKGESGILVLEDFARFFDIHPGDTMQLTVEDKSIDFEVIGIFKRELILTAPLKTSLDCITSITFSTAETVYVQVNDPSMLISGIRQNFPDCFAMKVEDITPALYKMIDRQFLFLSVLSLFSLGAGVVIVSSTVRMEVMERRRELGILKALGFKNVDISRAVIFEKCIVGILSGTVCAVVVAVGSHLLVRYLLGGEPSLPYFTVVALLSLTFVLTVVASYFPVRSALEEKPLHILRYE
jgi:putative ABC transport system permease protein